MRAAAGGGDGRPVRRLPDPCHDPAGLQERLLAAHGIEVPVFRFGDRVLVRPSFAGYNGPDDLERLLDALAAEVGRSL
jgi:hypothetical protein